VTVRVPDQERAPFFTPKTLAAYLALSESTIRAMLQRGTIPSYRIEGARRVAAGDVDAYLARRRDER
jgi:excisionase family DNA binding protein